MRSFVFVRHLPPPRPAVAAPLRKAVRTGLYYGTPLAVSHRATTARHRVGGNGPGHRGSHWQSGGAPVSAQPAKPPPVKPQPASPQMERGADPYFFLSRPRGPAPKPVAQPAATAKPKPGHTLDVSEEPLAQAHDYAVNGTFARRFRQWFGDSTVVDHQGAPQVVPYGPTREPAYIKAHDVLHTTDANEADQAFERGHDAVALHHHSGEVEYRVRHPHQVKAVRNVGTFGDHGDMHKSLIFLKSVKSTEASPALSGDGGQGWHCPWCNEVNCSDTPERGRNCYKCRRPVDVVKTPGKPNWRAQRAGAEPLRKSFVFLHYDEEGDGKRHRKLGARPKAPGKTKAVASCSLQSVRLT